MGLLDEAIREHLELKRRRGADPTEVERLEREALGPVRRTPHDAGEIELDSVEAVGGAVHSDDVGVADFDFDEQDEHEWVEPSHDEPIFDEDSGHEPIAEAERDAPRHHEIAEEWDSHEPLDLQEPPEAAATDEHLAEPYPAEPRSSDPEPPGEASPPAPVQADHLGEETAEYDVEAEHFEEGEGDDVLQETPEFLQDTPDHDRLWFEQKPPRDFDFDG